MLGVCRVLCGRKAKSAVAASGRIATGPSQAPGRRSRDTAASAPLSDAELDQLVSAGVASVAARRAAISQTVHKTTVAAQQSPKRRLFNPIEWGMTSNGHVIFSERSADGVVTFWVANLDGKRTGETRPR